MRSCVCNWLGWPYFYFLVMFHEANPFQACDLHLKIQSWIQGRYEAGMDLSKLKMRREKTEKTHPKVSIQQFAIRLTLARLKMNRASAGRQ